MTRPNMTSRVQIACRNANPFWKPPKKDMRRTRKFTIFRRLPRELQFRIWELTVQDYPATIWYLHETGPEIPNFSQRLRRRFLSHKPYFSQKNPAILTVCADARKMALVHYEPSFHEHSLLPIYFDFAKDALCFSDWKTIISVASTMMRTAGPAPNDGEKVTKVWWVTRDDCATRMVPALCQMFPKVEELNLMDECSNALFVREVEGVVKHVSMEEISTAFGILFRTLILDGIRNRNLETRGWKEPVIRIGTKEQWKARAKKLSLSTDGILGSAVDDV